MEHLKLSILKFIVQLSSVIISLLGLVCFIVSLAAFGSTAIFAEGDFKNNLLILKYVILIFGLGLICVGIFGFFGANRDNKYCLSIYGLIIGVFALAFFIIGIVGMTKALNNEYLRSISEPLTKVSKKNIFYNQSQFVNQTASILCSAQCECYLEENTLEAIKALQKTGNWSNIPFPLNYSTTNKSLPTKVQKCAVYQATKFTTLQKAFAASQSLLENDFACTGIFNTTAYYTFSDINDDTKMIGKFPNCAADIQQTIKSYGKKIGTVCMIVFAVLFLNCIFSICICCHPQYKKEQKKKNQGDGYEKQIEIN